MNKKLTIFSLPLLVIWIVSLVKIGFNIFCIIFGVIGSIIYISIVAGCVDGITKAKGEMYLANKYDKEKVKKDE